MSQFDRIWVVGAGAIGSVLAALLERGGRAAVTLVGASPHWRAVRRSGLVLEGGLAGERSGEPPVPETVALTTATLEEVPALDARDLVILAGKLPRLAATAARLRGRVGEGTGLLAVQNGLGVTDLVQGALGRAPERALVLFGAHLTAPGRVRHFPGRILLGDGPAARALADLLAGGLAVEAAADYRAAEWSKLALNCLANPLAALLGVPNARLAEPALDPLKESILAEVRLVAEAEGVRIDLDVPAFNRYMSGPTGGNTPSMAVDVRRGEPTEIAWINGAVVRLGRERGIPTPVNATLVALVEALAGVGASRGRA